MSLPLSFLNSDPLLPTNAVKDPKPEWTLPKVSWTPLMVGTYAWIGASLLLALTGYYVCGSSSIRTQLVCSTHTCTFETWNGRDSSRQPDERIVLPRTYLLKAQATRIMNGEPFDYTQSPRRRKQRVLGHSYSLSYKVFHDADGQDYKVKELLMSKFNLGRKRSRKQASRLMAYVNGDVPTVELRETKAWTGVGVLMVVFGLLSAFFGAVIGDLTGGEEEDKKGR